MYAWVEKATNPAVCRCPTIFGVFALVGGSESLLYHSVPAYQLSLTFRNPSITSRSCHLAPVVEAGTHPLPHALR